MNNGQTETTLYFLCFESRREKEMLTLSGPIKIFISQSAAGARDDNNYDNNNNYVYTGYPPSL